jgi:hypothetical protein
LFARTRVLGPADELQLVMHASACRWRDASAHERHALLVLLKYFRTKTTHVCR